MEFKLDQIVDIFKLIETVDVYSLPLWFSFAIPLFYVAFKKLAGAQETGSSNWIDQVLGFIKIPKIESGILWLSVVLFVSGILLVKLKQSHKEEVRKIGIRIKNYYLENNYYCLALDTIAKKTDLPSSRLEDLADEFPSEFAIVPDTNINGDFSPTFFLTDSLTLSAVLLKSEKLLDTYLSNQEVLPKKQKQSEKFSNLFVNNNFFTNRVILDLIVKMPEKYALDGNGKDPSIVLTKALPENVKLLNSYLENELKSDDLSVQTLYGRNPLFNEIVCMTLVTQFPEKYNISTLNQNLLISKK